MMQTTKYQVMPSLSSEEYEALKAAIAENGVEVPVVIDTDGNIVDGHHRVRAYEELLAEGNAVPMYPTSTRSDLTTDAEKRELAWRLNMQRRHLDQAQKRDAIAAKRKESPEWADNRIAHLLGVDSKTVRSVRTSLEIREELPKVELLEGKDGKYYPRNRSGDPSHLNRSSRHHDDVEKPMIEVEGKAYTPQDISRLITERQESERRLREMDDMLKAATHDVDEAVKEALEEERAEYLADLDAKIEAERERAKKLESDFTEVLADLKAKYGEEEPPDVIDVSEEEWEEVLKNAKSARVMQAGRSLQHYMGMKTALGEYLLVELAEAVRDVPHNEKFKENLRYVHERLGEVLDLVAQLQEMEERGLRGV
jgi:ParB-like chromosome segregation protein Spo0J